jgi:hypothetical protein
MSARKLGRFITAIGLAALAISCDVAGGLFSQSELADMYDVWIDLDGLPLSDGDLVRTDASLVPVIESRSGISSPERLTLVLVSEDGSEVASLGYVSAAGSAAYEGKVGSLRSVSSLEGDLPSFTLPDDLAEGYYFLETRLYNAAGRVLTDTSILVLVYNGDIPAPQIEVFPSSPALGQAVYLRLVSSLPVDIDPWLRWYISGKIGKEGYASDFADRLVWLIPDTDGFFSVRAELFPFKPPADASDGSISSGKPYSSAFRSDLILAVGPAGEASPLTGINRFRFMDFRSEPGSQMLESSDGTSLPVLTVGNPYLESHEHGYGHALMDGSGYMIPGTILPPAGTPFSLDLAFDPAAGSGVSGTLVSLHVADGAASFMRLGVSADFPYLEAGDSIVKSFSSLPTGLCRLVVEVVPSGIDAAESRVTLFMNDEMVGSGIVSASLFAQAEQVATLVGGPEGLDAVYDGLSVVTGRYQAFLMAKAHEFGNRLVVASGFEGGATGKGISVLGPAEARDGSIVLSPGSSLEIPLPSENFIVDIEGSGASLALTLVMDDGSTVVLQGGRPGPAMELGTASGGELAADPSGLAFTSVWLADHPVRLGVEMLAGGLRISDASGMVRRLPGSGTAVVLRVQPASSAPSTIRNIMVRTFSSVDSVSHAAGGVQAAQSGS